MAKPKIFPTCRICNKLNAEMTHCAIYGALSNDRIDNTALAAACNKSGDYVRLLHAVPNEYNYGRTPTGAGIDEDADNVLLVFDEDESKSFVEQHGMTLEEWAEKSFGSIQRDIHE